VSLERVPIAVPFQGGLDRKTDPKAAPVGRLLVCQNARFDVGSTLKKRNGYEAFATTVTGAGMSYANTKALAARGAEPVLLTDGAAYSHQDSLGTWSSIGPAASVAATDVSVAATATNQTQPDSATNQGVTLVAWEDSRGGVWWTLLEAEGGRVLRAPAQVDSAGQRPRCLRVGSVLHLVYATAVSELRILVVNPAAPTATVAPVALTTDLNSSQPSFDAEEHIGTMDDDPALIVWSRTGGGYRVGWLHQSGVLGSTSTGLPPVVDNIGVAVDVGPVISAGAPYAPGAGSNLAVVTYATAGTTTTITAHSDELALGASSTIVETAAVVRLTVVTPDDDNEGTRYVFREYTAATDRDHLVRVALVVISSSVTELATMRGVGLASRAFAEGRTAHAWVAHDVSFFSAYLCMRIGATGSTLCVSRTLPGLAYGLPDRAHLPSVQVDPNDSRVRHWCASWQQQFATEDGDSSVFSEVGIRRVSLDFDSSVAWQTAQLGRSLYLGGACPLVYDGDTMSEAGFHYAADDVTLTMGSNGAASQANGTYLYVVVYEWVDAQGELHRGPVSVPVAAVQTNGPTGFTRVNCPMYRITGKRNVRVGVFRSEAGSEGIFYRVSSLDPSATGPNGYVANDTTVDTVAFDDYFSDATLLTKEPIYTNGGIPSNDPTGSGSVIVGGKSRLFYTDPSDPLIVRYTQEVADGGGAEFSAELSLKVDPYSGAVTALAVMDDRLIVFKRSAIFAVNGAGPLRDPLADPSQGFSQAALVTSDAGCTAPASIAVTPAGIVFQSAKGIHLLGRDMSVSYVGAPVEAFNTQTVTRATLIEDRRQIVFLCSSGETLMFDYGVGQWSTYTNHTGLDAAVIDGTYHYLRTDGRVFRETPGVYRDDNSQIPMVLETAWIKLHPYLQGMSRFYHVHLIGELRSNHTIRFRYQTDYLANWSPANDVAWTTGSGGEYGEGNYGDGAYGGAADEVYAWKVHLGEVGRSIRFRFEDIEAAADAGPSYELSELLLEVGAKAIANRPYAAERTR